MHAKQTLDLLHTGNDTVNQLHVVENRIADFAMQLVGNLMSLLKSFGYPADRANEMAEGRTIHQLCFPFLQAFLLSLRRIPADSRAWQ